MDELLKHLTDIELIIMRAKLREHMFPQDTDFLLAVEQEIKLRDKK